MEAKTKDMFLPPTRIDTKLISELDDLVKRFGYSSRSELVREAIIDKISELKGMEIVQVRDIPKEEARKEILEYIKGKDRVYASDMAAELRLDLSLTFEIIDELFKEDALEVVP
ncbi:MAG: ribbon-helix-helix protein, CopG family [Methanocellales archaeon]|nr:ribbon-helix-helix protein, CopG family [Methanocellales archaeon]